MTYQNTKICFTAADQHKIPVEKSADQQKDDGTKKIGEENCADDQIGALGANQVEPWKIVGQNI